MANSGALLDQLEKWIEDAQKDLAIYVQALDAPMGMAGSQEILTLAVNVAVIKARLNVLQDVWRYVHSGSPR